MVTKSLSLPPVLLSRILFLLFALAGPLIFTQQFGYLGNQLSPNSPLIAWIWANLDGQHFINIALNGYQRTEFAYFPLYPLFIRLLTNLTRLDPLYSGISLSVIALILSIKVIRKIILLDYSPEIANLANLLLLFFPLSFFYHSVYPDSFFLLFTSLSLYSARRGRWAWSGLFAALSCLTRLSGIALIPALIYEWRMQEGKPKIAFVAPLLGSLGFWLYPLYLQIFYGNWLLFQQSMSAWKQDRFVLPFQVVFRYLKIFVSVKPNLVVYWIAVLEFVSLFGYLALSVFVWRKVRASYGLFMLVLLSLIGFTGTFAGTPRYLLHLFPAFIGLALLFKRYRAMRILVYLIYPLLGLFLTALFTRGYFVS